MREKFVETARAWLGKREADGSFREIIDLYNTQKPLPRGYKVKYSDSWCAVFVTAVAIKAGLEKTVPCECSCGQMIRLAQEKGIWQEMDGFFAKSGDILLYDWDDSGVGDNGGWPEHVGIVEKNENGVMTVIEGNLDNAVARRFVETDARYIRGFVCPKFLEETEYYPAFSGSTNSIVDALKSLKIDSSYKNRKVIAQNNGFLNYTGKANENLKMLALLKEGKLKK